MKNRSTVAVVLFASLLLAGAASAQELDLPRLSPKAAVFQTVGTTAISVSYCRPAVKGREIWGKLVPYDEPWRTGANEATTITFGDPAQVEGKALPAGTYALFTVPAKGDWTVVFSKQKDLWGSMGYKPEEDALRVTVKPVAGEFVERMQFVFTDVSDDAATMEMQWEKVRLPVKFTVDTQGKFLAAARKKMESYWNAPAQAASFCLQSGSNLEEALKWVNVSVSLQENYRNLTLKARVLAKMDKKSDAVSTMEKALGLAKGMKEPPYNLKEMEGLLAEWKK